MKLLVESPEFINVTDPYQMLQSQKCERWEECAEIVQRWKIDAFKLGVVVGTFLAAVFDVSLRYVCGKLLM